VQPELASKGVPESMASEQLRIGQAEELCNLVGDLGHGVFANWSIDELARRLAVLCPEPLITQADRIGHVVLKLLDVHLQEQIRVGIGDFRCPVDDEGVRLGCPDIDADNILVPLQDIRVEKVYHLTDTQATVGRDDCNGLPLQPLRCIRSIPQKTHQLVPGKRLAFLRVDSHGEEGVGQEAGSFLGLIFVGSGGNEMM